MDNIKLGIGFLAAAAIGAGVGYYATPTKVVKKTEYVEKIVVKRDTQTTITQKPDGTKVTVIENRDRINDDKSGHSETTTSRRDLNWLVSASYLRDLDGKATYVGSLQHRFIGSLYIGITATQHSGGVGVTLLF